MDIINARELYHEPLPEFLYWVEGVIPVGGIVIIGGYTKTGKSWFMLELADALSKGRNLFDVPQFCIPRPARVLYLEREVKRHGVQRRLKLRAVEPDPRFHIITTETRMLDEFWHPDLLETVRNYDVLIVDPISRFIKSDIDHETVARTFQIIEECQKASPQLAVVIIHHFRKPGDDGGWMPKNPLDPYNFRGPAKWIEAPDTLITLQRIPARFKDLEQWRLKSKFVTRHDKEPGNEEGMMGFVLNNEFGISERDEIVGPVNATRECLTEAIPDVGWQSLVQSIETL